jgi:hypothetical protein
MDEPIRDSILEVIEASLEAQLSAIRRLRKAGAAKSSIKRKKSRSQMDLAYDVLLEAGHPLHLKQIVEAVNARFGVTTDADSLGSALTKRVLKGDRFARPAKNTFALLEDEHAG